MWDGYEIDNFCCGLIMSSHRPIKEKFNSFIYYQKLPGPGQERLHPVHLVACILKPTRVALSLAQAEPTRVALSLAQAVQRCLCVACAPAHARGAVKRVPLLGGSPGSCGSTRYYM